MELLYCTRVGCSNDLESKYCIRTNISCKHNKQRLAVLKRIFNGDSFILSLNKMAGPEIPSKGPHAQLFMENKTRSEVDKEIVTQAEIQAKIKLLEPNTVPTA